MHTKITMVYIGKESPCLQTIPFVHREKISKKLYEIRAKRSSTIQWTPQKVYQQEMKQNFQIAVIENRVLHVTFGYEQCIIWQLKTKDIIQDSYGNYYEVTLYAIAEENRYKGCVTNGQDWELVHDYQIQDKNGIYDYFCRKSGVFNINGGGLIVSINGIVIQTLDSFRDQIFSCLPMSNELQINKSLFDSNVEIELNEAAIRRNVKSTKNQKKYDSINKSMKKLGINNLDRFCDIIIDTLHNNTVPIVEKNRNLIEIQRYFKDGKVHDEFILPLVIKGGNGNYYFKASVACILQRRYWSGAIYRILGRVVNPAFVTMSNVALAHNNGEIPIDSWVSQMNNNNSDSFFEPLNQQQKRLQKQQQQQQLKETQTQLPLQAQQHQHQHQHPQQYQQPFQSEQLQYQQLDQFHQIHQFHEFQPSQQLQQSQQEQKSQAAVFKQQYEQIPPLQQVPAQVPAQVHTSTTGTDEQLHDVVGVGDDHDGKENSQIGQAGQAAPAVQTASPVVSKIDSSRNRIEQGMILNVDIRKNEKKENGDFSKKNVQRSCANLNMLAEQRRAQRQNMEDKQIENEAIRISKDNTVDVETSNRNSDNKIHLSEDGSKSLPCTCGDPINSGKIGNGGNNGGNNDNNDNDNDEKKEMTLEIGNERLSSEKDVEESKLEEEEEIEYFCGIGRPRPLRKKEVLPARILLRLKQEWKHFEQEDIKKDTNAYGYVSALRWLIRKSQIH